MRQVRFSYLVEMTAVLAAMAWGMAGATVHASMSFLVEDNFTGGASATVEVTLDDESTPGEVKVTVDVVSPEADIRGVFFHVADESLLAGLGVTGDDVTGVVVDANQVINLGKGANLNGGQTNHGPYDMGVAIGSPGIGKDDVGTTMFTLSHNSEFLDVSFLAEQWFGIRLTSVGLSGARSGSSKLQGLSVPEPASMTSLMAAALAMLVYRPIRGSR